MTRLLRGKPPRLGAVAAHLPVEVDAFEYLILEGDLLLRIHARWTSEADGARDALTMLTRTNGRWRRLLPLPAWGTASPDEAPPGRMWRVGFALPGRASDGLDADYALEVDTDVVLSLPAPRPRGSHGSSSGTNGGLVASGWRIADPLAGDPRVAAAEARSVATERAAEEAAVDAAAARAAAAAATISSERAAEEADQQVRRAKAQAERRIAEAERQAMEARARAEEARADAAAAQAERDSAIVEAAARVDDLEREAVATAEREVEARAAAEQATQALAAERERTRELEVRLAELESRVREEAALRERLARAESRVARVAEAASLAERLDSIIEAEESVAAAEQELQNAKDAVMEALFGGGGADLNELVDRERKARHALTAQMRRFERAYAEATGSLVRGASGSGGTEVGREHPVR